MDAVVELFRRFDANGDGLLSCTDLASLLNSLNPQYWQERTIKALFAELDVDSDGFINYEQLVSWVRDSKSEMLLKGEFQEVGGSLRDLRPKCVESAVRAKFKEQEKAGQTKSYGAIGNSDYSIDALVWDLRTNADKRERVFGLSELMETLRAAYGDDFKKLRVLDLGCGDGRSLWTLHNVYGLPWSQLVGITAEDMRGVEVLSDEKPFDLRADAGPEAEQSYLVWNIELLNECSPLRGRVFDVVISWVTWIWLTDGLAALEMIHDHFLARGGVVLIGGVQMCTFDEPFEDQKKLMAVCDALVAHNHRIAAYADAGTGSFTWWLQRKSVMSTSRLGLARFINYRNADPVDECSHRVIYQVHEHNLGAYLKNYRVGEIDAPCSIPSLRVWDGDGDEELSDKGKATIAKFDLYCSRSTMDLASVLSSWITSEPCAPGQPAPASTYNKFAGCGSSASAIERRMGRPTPSRRSPPASSGNPPEKLTSMIGGRRVPASSPSGSASGGKTRVTPLKASGRLVLAKDRA